jgi:hypothetical protein
LRFLQRLQCGLARDAQRWQVELDDVPEAILPDCVVLMTQAVAKRFYFWPWLARKKSRRQISRFGRRFGDSFAALNRIVVF